MYHQILSVFLTAKSCLLSTKASSKRKATTKHVQTKDWASHEGISSSINKLVVSFLQWKGYISYSSFPVSQPAVQGKPLEKNTKLLGTKGNQKDQYCAYDAQKITRWLRADRTLKAPDSSAHLIAKPYKKLNTLLLKTKQLHWHVTYLRSFKDALVIFKGEKKKTRQKGTFLKYVSCSAWTDSVPLKLIITQSIYYIPVVYEEAHCHWSLA